MWRLGDGFCVLVLSVVTGRICETNGVFVESLRGISGWSSSVRTGRVRTADGNAADGDPADGGEDDDEAEAEDRGEAGDGGVVAGGAEDARGNC